MFVVLVVVLVVAALVGASWYAWERSHRRTQAMPGGLHEDIELPHEQEWELYHNDFSLCSKKSRVCLAELDLEYKAHHIDLIETGSYETLSRHFLSVNPGATVPVLVHNGHPIYESHEQINYAAAHAANGDVLVPADAKDRELMAYWVHKSSLIGDDPIAGMRETAGNAVPGLTLPIFVAMVADIGYLKILEGLLFHRLKRRAVMFMLFKLRGLRGLSGVRPMVLVIERSRAAMHTHLDELEEALARSGGPWIVGRQFTLADVGMMVVLERLAEGDWLDTFLTSARPHTLAYWAALQQRPSYIAAIAGHRHPTVVLGGERIVAAKADNPEFRQALLGEA